MEIKFLCHLALPKVSTVLATVLPVLLAFAPLAAFSMSTEERALLDLSEYRVHDKNAGYFDKEQRRAELAHTTDRGLRAAMSRLKKRELCAASVSIPVISGAEVTPRFYEDRDAWRRAAAPYHDFEDMVSNLAAQQFIAPDKKSGECLISLLDHWAANSAFLGFNIETSERQTWYQIESSLFAAAFAYSIIRGDIVGHDEEKQRIESWLAKAAKMHLAHPGTDDNTCCNNHFYRRALYAAIIGVVVDDDALFRVGISAIYSALSDASPDGALRLEMTRQQYSAKYQVYATMYLAFIAEVAARQGYDMYSLKFNGRSLDEIVSFSVASILSPESAAQAANTPNQDTEFLKDKQYFSWLELLSRRPLWRDTSEALLSSRRPAYNRSLGGYTTLYYFPAVPAQN